MGRSRFTTSCHSPPAGLYVPDPNDAASNHARSFWAIPCCFNYYAMGCWIFRHAQLPWHEVIQGFLAARFLKFAYFENPLVRLTPCVNFAHLPWLNHVTFSEQQLSINLACSDIDTDFIRSRTWTHFSSHLDASIFDSGHFALCTAPDFRLKWTVDSLPTSCIWIPLSIEHLYSTNCNTYAYVSFDVVSSLQINQWNQLGMHRATTWRGCWDTSSSRWLSSKTNIW